MNQLPMMNKPPVTTPIIMPVRSAPTEEIELMVVMVVEINGRPSILLRFESPDDNEVEASSTSPLEVVAEPSIVTEPDTTV